MEIFTLPSAGNPLGLAPAEAACKDAPMWTQASAGDVGDAPSHIEYPCLQAAKRRLDAVKARMGGVDRRAWAELVRARDPFRLARGDAERRGAQAVTNAWFKFWELLRAFPDLARGHTSNIELPILDRHEAAVPLRAAATRAHERTDRGSGVITMVGSQGAESKGSAALHSESKGKAHADAVRSFHMAEAPGAFVAALNHWLDDAARSRWEWRAETLRSGLQDAYGLIAAGGARWLWGEDGTGDLNRLPNLRHFARLFADDKRSLVTSDCGAEPTTEQGFVDQERDGALLLWKQLLLALDILAEGGTLVLKVFTLFEASSIGQLYLLANCFDKLHVCKPAASRGQNSELYIVARGYRPLSATFAANWLDLVPLVARFPPLFRAVPRMFGDRAAHIALWFAEQQRAALEQQLDRLRQYAHDKRDVLDGAPRNRDALRLADALSIPSRSLQCRLAPPQPVSRKRGAPAAAMPTQIIPAPTSVGSCTQTSRCPRLLRQ